MVSILGKQVRLGQLRHEKYCIHRGKLVICTRGLYSALTPITLLLNAGSIETLQLSNSKMLKPVGRGGSTVIGVFLQYSMVSVEGREGSCVILLPLQSR